MTNRDIKLGFIIDNETVSYEEYEIITELCKKFKTKKHVCISQIDTYSRSTLFIRVIKFFKNLVKLEFNPILNSIFLRIINSVELKRVRNNPNFSNYKKEFSIKNLDLEITKIKPVKSKNGFFYEYNVSDIQNLKEKEIDLLIRFGGGILRGEILNFENGIISFHHGDNREVRGSMPGFWEVYYDMDSTGFVIQLLDENLDNGKIIFRGSIPTRDFWYENHANILLRSKNILIDEIDKFSKNKKFKFIEDTLHFYSNSLFKKPSGLQLGKYIFQVYTSKLVKKIIKIFYKKNKIPEWNIKFLFDDSFKKPFYKSTLIKNPKNRFLADPFIFKHLNKYFCFVEDYFYDKKKGKISCIEIVNQKNYIFHDVVLEENFHLSYPFIFQNDDQIYMMPETSENKDIRLYRAIEFPFKWEFSHKLIDNIDAADSIIFKENNFWYLLTSVNSAATTQPDHSELNIFYSDDLNSDKWLPHKNNPIYFDSKKGRNGGYFTKDGKHFRVNQVFQNNFYGHSFEINEILNISNDDYIEKKLTRVSPDIHSSELATHHFNYENGVIVFDVMKFK